MSWGLEGALGLTGTKPLEGWLSVGQAHQRIIHQDTLDIQNTLGCTTEYTWVQHRIHSKDQELVWISEFVARRDARAAIVSCWPECSIDAQQRLRRIAQEIIFPPNQHKKCRACLTVMNFLCFCWWCNLLDTWVGLFNAFGWSSRTRTFVFF